MDVSAIVHDHGPDVSKMGKQCGIHDFLCFDHELDLTVNAGISCDSFGPIFRKAADITSTLRSSNNCFRRLRDFQVSDLFYFAFTFHAFVFSTL